MATPYFYILMRTDLASMNPGKAVAQGTHAASQFESTMAMIKTQVAQTGNELLNGPGAAMIELYDIWKGEAQDFGTAICLGVNQRQMQGAVSAIQGSTRNLISGIVRDPTYPLMDGEVLHLIPLDTCAWVFGDKDDIQWYLTDLGLMK